METYYVVRVIFEDKTRYVGGPEFTPWFGEAFLYKVRSTAEEIGRSYKGCGRKVEICELEFTRSYEV